MWSKVSHNSQYIAITIFYETWKYIYISITFQNRVGRGYWDPSFGNWEHQDLLASVVMVIDGLAMQGSQASAGVALTSLTRVIPVPSPEGCKAMDF